MKIERDKMISIKTTGLLVIAIVHNSKSRFASASNDGGHRQPNGLTVGVFF
jgi:hypothetical protein